MEGVSASGCGLCFACRVVGWCVVSACRVAAGKPLIFFLTIRKAGPPGHLCTKMSMTSYNAVSLIYAGEAALQSAAARRGSSGGRADSRKRPAEVLTTTTTAAPAAPAGPAAPGCDDPPSKRQRAASAASAAPAEEAEKCAICLDALYDDGDSGLKRDKQPLERTPCGHVFHEACLHPWRKFCRGRCVTCPACRALLSFTPEDDWVHRRPLDDSEISDGERTRLDDRLAAYAAHMGDHACVRALLRRSPLAGGWDFASTVAEHRLLPSIRAVAEEFGPRHHVLFACLYECCRCKYREGVEYIAGVLRDCQDAPPPPAKHEQRSVERACSALAEAGDDLPALRLVAPLVISQKSLRECAEEARAAFRAEVCALLMAEARGRFTFGRPRAAAASGNGGGSTAALPPAWLSNNAEELHLPPAGAAAAVAAGGRCHGTTLAGGGRWVSGGLRDDERTRWWGGKQQS